MRATRTDEAETETDDGVRRTDPRAREGRREQIFRFLQKLMRTLQYLIHYDMYFHKMGLRTKSSIYFVYLGDIVRKNRLLLLDPSPRTEPTNTQQRNNTTPHSLLGFRLLRTVDIRS